MTPHAVVCTLIRLNDNILLDNVKVDRVGTKIKGGNAKNPPFTKFTYDYRTYPTRPSYTYPALIPSL